MGVGLDKGDYYFSPLISHSIYRLEKQSKYETNILSTAYRPYSSFPLLKNSLLGTNKWEFLPIEIFFHLVNLYKKEGKGNEIRK